MTRNLAQSVRQRLLNLARERGEEFQLVLVRYGLERLLFRLTQSPHAGQFVLKGAMLFQLWTGQPHRSTRDLDLLGHGAPSADRLRQLFAEVCSVSVEDDGLTFRIEGIEAGPIREGDEYQGVRVQIPAYLGSARIALQIDIGFGDAITPAPSTVSYPAILDFPAPQLLAYPRETVVAEKYQALTILGIANSRMKDFYDLWTLARQFSFAGPLLCAAIAATFARRNTPLPAAPPIALTAEFSDDRVKSTQWKAWLKKTQPAGELPSLEEVVALLETFLMPPTLALVGEKKWDRSWHPVEWK